MSAGLPLDTSWSPDRAAVARTMAVLIMPRTVREDLTEHMAAGREFWIPDDAPGLSPQERATRLTSWVVDGLKLARVFYVEPSASELAIRAGGDLPGAALPRPPVPFGLLVAPGGLGYTSDGWPLIAVSWQPSPVRDGITTSWWTDIQVWLADLLELGQIRQDQLSQALRDYGLLHYVHTTSVTHWAPGDPGPAPAQPDDGPHRIVAAPGLGDEAIGATYALHGAWQLLADQQLHTERLRSVAAEKDRDLGLTPSAITRVWADSEPAQTWRQD